MKSFQPLPFIFCFAFIAVQGNTIILIHIWYSNNLFKIFSMSMYYLVINGEQKGKKFNALIYIRNSRLNDFT